MAAETQKLVEKKAEIEQVGEASSSEDDESDMAQRQQAIQGWTTEGAVFRHIMRIILSIS